MITYHSRWYGPKSVPDGGGAYLQVFDDDSCLAQLFNGGLALLAYSRVMGRGDSLTLHAPEGPPFIMHNCGGRLQGSHAAYGVKASDDSKAITCYQHCLGAVDDDGEHIYGTKTMWSVTLYRPGECDG